MRHAFVASTPVTLIEAMNFVVTFNIEESDVYITKSFSMAEHVAKRLEETGIFENVFLTEDVLLTYPITIKKCVKTVLNGRKLAREIGERYYDYGYYNNSGWLVNSIFYTGFIKRNKACKQRFIEHGYNTYLNEYGKKPKYLRPLIRLSGFKCMDGSMLEALYMYHPSFLKVHQDGEIREMPCIDKNNKRLIDAINHTFCFDPSDNPFSSKQIIVMEQGPQKVDFDKEKYWKEILKNIPREKAIIKAHPRMKESVLYNFGIDIYKNNSLPWEVIALNTNMENKVQMAMFSGSCLLPKLLCNIESTIILLYKLLPVDYTFLGKDIDALVTEITKLYEDKDNIFVPESLEELYEFFYKRGITKEEKSL